MQPLPTRKSPCRTFGSAREPQQPICRTPLPPRIWFPAKAAAAPSAFFSRLSAPRMLDPALKWVKVLDASYHDQAHFSRDFRDFMDVAPRLSDTPRPSAGGAQGPGGGAGPAAAGFARAMKPLAADAGNSCPTTVHMQGMAR